ncbi:MAG: sigma-54-dependent Fis family transcriptional regulator [Bdellovibrionales bacterium]|nr:sigma-54-dependent Fis family transcriptional regulator [Bdellovibrionales bacterium]
MIKLLVVDDEESILDFFSVAFSKDQYIVDVALDGELAMDMVQKSFYDVVVTDLTMPKMNGLDLLSHIKKESADSQVVMMTAYGSTETAVKAMKLGAFDYITKPFEIDEVRKILSNAIEHRELKRRNDAYHQLSIRQYEKRKMIGESEQTKSLIEMLEKISPGESSVLITGESGTGKELVAREIHYRSDRAQQPFVPINCAAIPENLIEAELFGYEKGAFTGADQKKMGLFESAHRGSIFLDEIGELPLHLQSKLLRVLAERSLTRVGGRQNISVDVRLISATNQNLEKLVDQKQFRQDLFYRINVIHLELSPLRERKEDIPTLATHFYQQYNRKYRKDLEGMDQSFLESLCKYSFPGNVRELENIVEQAVVLETGKRLTDQSIPVKVRDKISSGSQSKVSVPRGSLDQTLESVERKAIAQALHDAKGNKTKAADLLKISFRSLRYRLEKLGIDD